MIHESIFFFFPGQYFSQVSVNGLIKEATYNPKDTTKYRNPD